MEKESPKIYKFSSLQSTNQKLNDLNKEANVPEFTVVVTEEQTAGRGQMGNNWESERGKNLTFSILIRPCFLPIHQQFRITQIVTLSLIRLLQPLLQNVTIKWPNDIYCNNKKIAGVLVENSLKGNQIEYSIIGVGLNVNQKKFYSDAKNPVSIAQLTQQESSISDLLNQLLICFVEIYSDWVLSKNDVHLHQNYLKNLYRGTGLHRFRDSYEEFYAEIYEIEASGHLLLKTQSGKIKRYAFKEVSFKL